MGYANAVITLDFSNMSDDPQNDRIWVAIRNPKLMTLDAMRPRDIATNPDGTPIMDDEATLAMFEIIASLIVGWRAYPSDVFELDANGNLVPVELLPLPATPALVRRLPMEIITSIGNIIREAQNPQ